MMHSCLCGEDDPDAFGTKKSLCRSCLAEKSRDRYAADPERFRQLSRDNRQKHKDKILANNRQYRADNPERVRIWQRRSKRKTHGWSDARWDSMMIDQNGLCAVEDCGNPATDADHDHHTNEARSPLCSGCNKALGLLGDDMYRVLGLARYLESYS